MATEHFGGAEENSGQKREFVGWVEQTRNPSFADPDDGVSLPLNPSYAVGDDVVAKATRPPGLPATRMARA
jgi:hypothetical protein